MPWIYRGHEMLIDWVHATASALALARLNFYCDVMMYLI